MKAEEVGCAWPGAAPGMGRRGRSSPITRVRHARNPAPTLGPLLRAPGQHWPGHWPGPTWAVPGPTAAEPGQPRLPVELAMVAGGLRRPGQDSEPSPSSSPITRVRRARNPAPIQGFPAVPLGQPCPSRCPALPRPAAAGGGPPDLLPLWPNVRFPSMSPRSCAERMNLTS